MLINIILIIVVIISGWFLVKYNLFIRKSNKIKESEAQIDVLLNQRFDLIPNIIECVKGYTKHESSTLKKLTDLRTSYNKNEFSIEETEKVDKNFNNIMLLAEAYPDLKANTQFLDLQNTLKEIENKLSYARSNYNNVVTSYNNLVESIPSNIIAKIFVFEKKELFKLDIDKKEDIKIKF